MNKDTPIPGPRLSKQLIGDLVQDDRNVLFVEQKKSFELFDKIQEMADKGYIKFKHNLDFKRLNPEGASLEERKELAQY